MKQIPKKAATSKYRIEQRESPAHGGLYELEQDFYIDIIDNRTGQVVVTLESEGWASLGTNGMWDDLNMSGVEKVEMSPDERSVLVYSYSAHDPKKIDLP